MRGPACPTCGYEPTQPGNSCACLDPEMERIMALSPEQVDAELRAEGMDPVKVPGRIFTKVAASMGDEAPEWIKRRALQSPAWVAEDGES